jgi:small conductance mechanosensitive channel
MHPSLLERLSNPNDLQELALRIAIQIALAALIFYVGRLVVRLSVRFVTRGMRRARADETLVVFLEKVLRALGVTIVVVAVLSQLGIDTTSAAAVLGGAALAIGLALQNQLSSFAAGVLLIVFRPIRVGEWVEAGGKSGTVTEVNIFSTALINLENQMVYLPNAKVWSDTITNHTRNSWRRLDLTIGISYDSDLLKAKKILENLIADDSRVRKTPPPAIAVKNLGANSVDLSVRLCTAVGDAWSVQCELYERIKLRFDAERIVIPSPPVVVQLQAPPQASPLPDARS